MRYFYLILIFTCGSCINRFVFTLNDQDVANRYALKEPKPSFKTIDNEGSPLFYTTIGDTTKPILVFIHGAPGHWYSSLNMIDDKELQANFKIIAYDRPGFGKSGTNWATPDVDDQVSALRKILLAENKKNNPIILVGRSYGTTIAARYAMLYSSEVKKLLLLASCIDPKRERFFWYSYASKIGLVSTILSNELNNTSVEKFKHRKQLWLMHNDWDKITASTYLVHGTKDDIAFTSNADYGFNKITNADVHKIILDGVKHNVTRERPELIKSIILGKL